MNFSETPGYSKDFKHLSKKYRSLPEDLAEFKKIVSSVPCGTSKHFAVLHQDGDTSVIKARLFCKYLRGSSLRIVYAYDKSAEKIVFIELFFKGDKERENCERIDDFMNRRCPPD